uniref:Uncharacterized protein n=1 Tax=Caenorhabditis japonica TaxID=281687 RepID=A0A8R1HJU6_CAEJA
MKIIPKTELQNTSSSEKGPHQKDLKSATEIVEPVNPVKLTEKSSPLKNAVNKVPEHVEKKEEKPITISVRDDVKEMPKASENVRIAVKTPKQEPKDDSVEPSQKSPLKNPENSVKRTSPRLRERKAETPEVVKNEKPENHCHDFHKQGRSSGRRGANNKKKEPYCRHCELLEEEKKKEKKRRKTEGETSNEIKKKEEIKEISKKEKDAVEKQETPKRGRSGRKKMEQQGQSITGIKRRSATITPEEPQVKKKRLSDSDLISIPSSTAVVVDTELIAAENEHISIENLPKFAEKSDSQFASSIWNSPADAQLLEEVKKTASRKERKLFGVPLSNVSENKTMINVWVDNVDPNISDKDVFSNDLRRMMAQDKKARMDGKAGYGVRQ